MIGYFKRISDGARICRYVECAILICTAELCNSDVLCTGLCKPVQSSRRVQLAELGTIKSGSLSPPHTRHTLCHCQLALFQSYDGDHNENDASKYVDDSDDVLLLHTLHTLCQLALFQGHRHIKDIQNGLVTVIHMF